MRLLSPSGYLVHAGLLALVFYSHGASAQDRRGELTDAYKEHFTGSRPIYQAAPVTHVVPEFNTVTYVIDAKSINTIVSGDPEVTPPSVTEDITVKGYRASPYLALSLKRVGLGFNIEAGQMSIAYRQLSSSASSTQESSVTYRGLGIFGFLKLIDTKHFDLTLVGGGRSINARHIIGPVKSSWDPNANTYEKAYRYTLNNYEAGINNEFHLLKSVTLTPWVNYSRTDDANAVAQVKEYDYNTDTMRGDLDVFWQSHRTVDYGIDIGLRIREFEVRLGGMLGMVFSSAGGSAQVEDNGYSLSLSLHTKG